MFDLLTISFIHSFFFLPQANSPIFPLYTQNPFFTHFVLTLIRRTTVHQLSMLPVVSQSGPLNRPLSFLAAIHRALLRASHRSTPHRGYLIPRHSCSPHWQSANTSYRSFVAPAHTQYSQSSSSGTGSSDALDPLTKSYPLKKGGQHVEAYPHVVAAAAVTSPNPPTPGSSSKGSDWK